MRKDRLWTSSGVGGNGNGDVVGWLDSKMFDETGDEQKSQGWTPFVLDTNGNGKRDEGYVEPNQPVDPTKDKRIVASASTASRRTRPTASIWGSVLGFPGSVVRVDPGAIRRRPRWRKSTRCRLPGYSPRGMDIDSKGVVWTPLASGHLAQLRPPQVQGPAQRPDRDRQALPGRLDALSAARPAVRDGVDRTPAAPRRATTPGSISTTRSGSARTCRSPPATSRTRCSRWSTASSSSCACRIRWASSPRAWTAASTIPTPAGRAAASGRPTGNRTPFHIEGGKGTQPKVVKFQMRPDPLAH